MPVLTLAAAGLVTWLMRASFIVLGDRVRLSPFAGRMVQNARHAMLAALVGTALATGGTGEGAVVVHWAAALAVTAWVATRTRTLILIVASGMGTLWALTLLAAW